MTYTVELPALDGRIPLGFLAALGLLRLVEESSLGPVRLSFTAQHSTAVLHSAFRAEHEIASHLGLIVGGTEADAVIPGLTAGFPLQGDSGPDPMRPARQALRQVASDLSRKDTRAVQEWLPSLLTDLAIDQQGRAAITPFMSPRGQQKMRSFFGKPLQHVRAQTDYLQEALTGWRRVSGVTGEYLDHRALNSPTDDPAGMKQAERGVPGATWLATMAMPMLRLTGNGEHVAATLWHQAGRRQVMIWPLWRQPLEWPAIQALIEHPSLEPTDSVPTVRSAGWQLLGVTGVYGAERRKLPDTDKSRGVLTSVQVAVAP